MDTNTSVDGLLQTGGIFSAQEGSLEYEKRAEFLRWLVVSGLVQNEHLIHWVSAVIYLYEKNECRTHLTEKSVACIFDIDESVLSNKSNKVKLYLPIFWKHYVRFDDKNCHHESYSYKIRYLLSGSQFLLFLFYLNLT